MEAAEILVRLVAPGREIDERDGDAREPLLDHVEQAPHAGDDGGRIGRLRAEVVHAGEDHHARGPGDWQSAVEPFDQVRQRLGPETAVQPRRAGEMDVQREGRDRGGAEEHHGTGRYAGRFPPELHITDAVLQRLVAFHERGAAGDQVALAPGCDDSSVEVTQTGTSTVTASGGSGATGATSSGGTSSGGSGNGGSQPQCSPGGADCDAAIDCCSLTCKNGVCDDSGSGCAQLGDSCGDAAERCSNKCEGGVCDQGGGCLQPGDDCTTGGSVCCSGVCVDNPNQPGEKWCGQPLSGCHVEGEVCSTNADCCGNLCADNGSGIKTCVPQGACFPVGEACSGPSQCCSNACIELLPGAAFCQSIGGCKPIGELCSSDASCCTKSCQTEPNGVKKCGLPANCRPPGEICDESFGECCPGVPQGKLLCFEGSYGVLRCHEPCCLFAGTVCATDDDCDCVPTDGECLTPDDCCGGICAPDPNDGGKLKCNPGTSGTGGAGGSIGTGGAGGAPMCLGVGEGCSSNADCCSGLRGGGEFPTCDDSPCKSIGAFCATSSECCAGLSCVDSACSL